MRCQHNDQQGRLPPLEVRVSVKAQECKGEGMYQSLGAGKRQTQSSLEGMAQNREKDEREREIARASNQSTR